MIERDLGDQVAPRLGNTFSLHEAEASPTNAMPEPGAKRLPIRALFDVVWLISVLVVVTAVRWDLGHLLTAASVRLGVPVMGLVFAAMGWLGSYDQSQALRWPRAVSHVGRAVGLGVGMFALTAFLFDMGGGARVWLLLVSVLWFVGLALHHGIWAMWRPHRSRVIVAGGGAVEAVAMRTALRRDRRRRHHVVGFVVDHMDDDTPELVSKLALGSLDDLPHLVDRYQADQVVFCLDGLSGGKFARLARLLGQKGVNVALTGLGDVAMRRVGTAQAQGRPLITIAAPVRTGWQLAVKRAVDIAVSAGLLLVLAPLALLIALAIRIIDRQPPIFAQPRVGKGGELFTIYKFRSMSVDLAEAEIDLRNDLDGPLFKMAGDPRVTRLGAFLRKASLDELPQLWNVLKGDMSLVGPRPFIQSEVEAAPPEFRYREIVTPGMTGQWQVSGRSDTDFDQLDELDRWYVDNWSLGQDLEILARTVPAVLMQRGAR